LSGSVRLIRDARTSQAITTWPGGATADSHVLIKSGAGDYPSSDPIAAGHPIAALPVLFHLLWRHELEADLSAPLHQATLVRPVLGPGAAV
jgi:hypothetical protein